jgi:hypothetical protein
MLYSISVAIKYTKLIGINSWRVEILPSLYIHNYLHQISTSTASLLRQLLVKTQVRISRVPRTYITSYYWPCSQWPTSASTHLTTIVLYTSCSIQKWQWRNVFSRYTKSFAWPTGKNVKDWGLTTWVDEFVSITTDDSSTKETARKIRFQCTIQFRHFVMLQVHPAINNVLRNNYLFCSRSWMCAS